MKYVVEYHMVEGKFVGRECKDQDEMDSIVSSFAGSRKGTHDFTVKNEQSGQDVRIVIPLEQVKVVRGYAVEDSPKETEEE